MQISIKKIITAVILFSLLTIPNIAKVNADLTPEIKAIDEQTIYVGTPLILPIIASNPNNAMLMYAVSNAPQDATMTREGVLYWIPKTSGDYTFNVVVSDGITPPVSSPVTVHVQNNPTPKAPIIEPVALGLIKAGVQINYQIKAYDENGDPLHYKLNPSNLGTVNSQGLFSWTPIKAGEYKFKLTVSDGKHSTTRQFTITVVEDYNVIMKWNIELGNYINAKAINNQFGSRAMAMMHTAMFDAVNSITNQYTPYYLAVSAPKGASVEAAAASAANKVLTTLYSADASLFDQIYSTQLSAIPDSQSKSDGIAIGIASAENIIQLRSNDNSAIANIPYVDGTLPGEYRRTGPMAPLLPGWGSVTPWGLASSSQFRLSGQPALTSTTYTTAYNQVKSLGDRESNTRTAQQSEDALFWIAGVPDHWHAIAREISARNKLSLESNARLFALLSVTLADASISGWDTKYTHKFWRPITAIAQGELDGNPETAGNPSWRPFITTPAFPEYGSGHSTTCNSAASLLAKFFGSNSYIFTRASSTPGLPTHEYHSFSQMAEEAGASRIPAGVHFFFSNDEALAAGASIGDYVFQNLMQPIHGKSQPKR